MKVKIRTANADRFLGKLRKIDQAGTEAVRATIEHLVTETRDIAKASMEGAGTSLPGEPPTSKSGDLEASVKARVRKLSKGYRGVVGTDELKGYFLEFGRSNMEPRPWLHPAFREATSDAERELRRQMERLI